MLLLVIACRAQDSLHISAGARLLYEQNKILVREGDPWEQFIAEDYEQLQGINYSLFAELSYKFLYFDLGVGKNKKSYKTIERTTYDFYNLQDSTSLTGNYIKRADFYYTAFPISLGYKQKINFLSIRAGVCWIPMLYKGYIEPSPTNLNPSTYRQMNYALGGNFDISCTIIKKLQVGLIASYSQFLTENHEPAFGHYFASWGMGVKVNYIIR